MPQDLSYLLKLPRDRYVSAVCLAGNKGSYGGVLVKFLMYNRTTELILLISGPAKATYKLMIIAKKEGCLPELSDDDHERMVKLIPMIINDD